MVKEVDSKNQYTLKNNLIDIKKSNDGKYNYISPVFYLTDTKLKIIIQDGKKATITNEEHTRFFNEHKGV